MRRLTEKQKLLVALRDCVHELSHFVTEAACDHEAGVCYCSYWRTLERAKKLVAAHERTDEWLAKLEIDYK